MSRDEVLKTIRRAKRGGEHRVGGWSIWCEAYTYNDLFLGRREGHYVHARHDDGARFSIASPRAAIDAMMERP